MYKKGIIAPGAILIILVLIFQLSGCAGGAKSGDKVEMMEALDETVTSASDTDNESSYRNEDIDEMRHWKSSANGPDMEEYGQEIVVVPQDGSPAATLEAESGESNTYSMAPYTNEEYSGETVSIQIVTVEQMDLFVQKLIDLGYLDEKPESEEEFRKAVTAFQSDNNLNSTGNLDGETMALLSE